MDEEAEKAVESLLANSQPGVVKYQISWTKVIEAPDQLTALREARRILRAPEGPDAVFDVREARKGAHGRPVTSSPSAGERENEQLASRGVLNHLLDITGGGVINDRDAIARLESILRLAWSKLTLDEHKAVYRDLRLARPNLQLPPLLGDK